jgi:hypothetical protein
MMCDPAEARAVQIALNTSIKFIIDAQHETGGWGYQSQGRPDTSLSVMQLMALRASRQCGISVPQPVIDRAVSYLVGNQSAGGNFRYRANQGDGPAYQQFNMTAGAVASLMAAGVPANTPALQNGFAFLQSAYADHTMKSSFGIYGIYYACHAFQQMGGQAWEQYYAYVERLLHQTQVAGAWQSPRMAEDVATPMAIICLCSPRRLLPLFARA